MGADGRGLYLFRENEVQSQEQIVKDRLILRRQLKSRYPAHWRPGGKDLDEWRRVCAHRVRFTDLADGQYFCIDEFVCRKASDLSAYLVCEDTSEILLNMNGHDTVLGEEDVL